MFRITVPGSKWSTRRLRWSFWLLNIGLVVMVLLSVMPVGFRQLEVGFTESYAASRSLAFYNSDLVQLLF